VEFKVPALNQVVELFDILKAPLCNQIPVYSVIK
jgi:hypothetical protein